MKDPAQSNTIYQGLSSNKNDVYIKDRVQPNQTVYIMDPAQSTEMYNTGFFFISEHFKIATKL